MKWYVSLGEGTWAALDKKPFVFLATDENIEKINSLFGGEAPSCDDEMTYESHIHIEDLVKESHWADHTPVTERSTPEEVRRNEM